MSAPVLVLVGGLGGALLGLSVRATTHDGHRLAVRASGLFAALAVAPIGLALYALYPDWSMMYAVHPAHVNEGFVIALLTLIYLSAPCLGCVTTRFLMASPRGFKLARAGMGFGVLILVTLVALSWDRLMSVAYYESFHYGGTVISLVRSTLFFPLLLSGSAASGVYVFSFLHLKKTGV